jgi:hypothetical protein
MAKQRDVEVIEGEGKFASSNQIIVNLKDGAKKTLDLNLLLLRLVHNHQRFQTHQMMKESWIQQVL